MTHSRAALLLVLLCPLSFAQTQQPKPAPPFFAIPQMTEAQRQNFSPELLDQLVAIKNAALSDDYAYRQVAHLTENIGPRPVGSPQANAAVEYVAGQLRDLGLEVRLEEVRAPRWVRGLETAELVDYPGHVPGVVQKIVVTA